MRVWDLGSLQRPSDQRVDFLPGEPPTLARARAVVTLDIAFGPAFLAIPAQNRALPRPRAGVAPAGCDLTWEQNLVLLAAGDVLGAVFLPLGESLSTVGKQRVPGELLAAFEMHRLRAEVREIKVREELHPRLCRPRTEFVAPRDERKRPSADVLSLGHDACDIPCGQDGLFIYLGHYLSASFAMQ